MDRLTLIEVIAAELRLIAPYIGEAELGVWAGRVADAIIRRIGLRSLRGGGNDPEGGTMPSGPWSGSP